MTIIHPSLCHCGSILETPEKNDNFADNRRFWKRQSTYGYKNSKTTKSPKKIEEDTGSQGDEEFGVALVVPTLEVN